MDVTRIVVHKDVVRDLAASPGVVVELAKWATIISARAKARITVRSGRAQRGIVTRVGRDAFGAYADVVSTARGDNGYPYPLKLEKRRPYLRPSIPGRTI
jgi:hypothetical protein